MSVYLDYKVLQGSILFLSTHRMFKIRWDTSQILSISCLADQHLFLSLNVPTYQDFRSTNIGYSYRRSHLTDKARLAWLSNLLFPLHFFSKFIFSNYKSNTCSLHEKKKSIFVFSCPCRYTRLQPVKEQEHGINPKPANRS